MVDKRGTGDELGRIDLGPIGEIAVSDDGDNDVYVTFDTMSLTTQIHQYRDDHGDDAVIDVLDKIQYVDDSTNGNGSTSGTHGPFVCDHCNRTFPSHANETPDQAQDTCPDCAERSDVDTDDASGPVDF